MKNSERYLKNELIKQGADDVIISTVKHVNNQSIYNKNNHNYK